jgi:very-short-patch-repair endonuclease
MKITYNLALKEKARQLRNDSTLSEVLLWQKLRKGQMHGYDFHRQKPILEYIVDFFCNKLQLVIEVDGSSHDDKFLYDAKRQQEMEALGIQFLRFTDKEVKSDMDNVLMAIEQFIIDFENKMTT